MPSCQARREERRCADELLLLTNTGAGRSTVTGAQERKQCAVSKQRHRRIIKEYGNLAFVKRGKRYDASQTSIVDSAAYVTF